MDITASLAWIHWDPPRFAFTVPIIKHPVAWYGICFALGFILGYLLIIPIFKSKLAQTRRLFDRDIANWPGLINHLKKGISGQDSQLIPIIKNLREKTQKSLLTFKCMQEPDQQLKLEILQALNSCMAEPGNQLCRESIEALFPKAIHPLRDLCISLTDRLTWFVLGGTIIGARLGHVVFYDWPRYKENPVDVFKVWEGGLASHGGTIGIMIALYLYCRMIRTRFPELSFLVLLDILCIPTALAAVWIRIGNFFNQEILGPVTSLPWAIVFGHPYDGSSALPRHPSQLYEAVAYGLIFLFLITLWKKKYDKLPSGTFIGFFMVAVFGFRFLVEFLKTPQSLIIDESFLNAGQYLSIPFIFMGLCFIIYPKLSKKPTKPSLFPK